MSGRGRIRTRGLRLRRASHYPGYATRPARSELPQIQWFRWVPWATWIAAPISAGGVSTVSDALPDPYGRGFDAGEDTVARVRSAWERREQSRLSAGSLARRPWQSVLRSSLGPTVLLISVLRLIAPNLGSSGALLIIYLMIHSVAALAPSLIATEMSFQALGARRSLREVGGIPQRRRHDLAADPGMDRIREGMNVARRMQVIQALLVMMALSSIIFASFATSESRGTWQITHLLASACGLMLTFVQQTRLDDYARLDDPLPYLTLHAPTHHPTELETILSSVVRAHLDPDLALEWEAWEEALTSFANISAPSSEVMERFLYLQHLLASGQIRETEARQELKEFIDPIRVDELLEGPNDSLDAPTLRRLIAHASAWQPDLFHLFQRLQKDLLIHGESISRGGLRVDLAMDTILDEGHGHLFIALNNQSDQNRSVGVEVIVTDGEPEVQNYRLGLRPCPAPTGPLPLLEPGAEDVASFLPRYLERGFVLWLGVSWKRGVNPSQAVIVNLRSEDGQLLSSETLLVEVHHRPGEAARNRRRAIRQARMASGS